jgi:hypothetical protein
VEPTGITLPAGTTEHLLPGASAQVTINGVDYVTSRNLVSLELAFKNNLRLDSGFYPGSGTQDGVAVRGRIEFGDREASLKSTARFENGSSELTKLRNQTEGTAVVSLQGELISGTDYHSLAVTFHRVVFRSAVVGDTDGIVTVEVECQPLWKTTNGLLTAVAMPTRPAGSSPSSMRILRNKAASTSSAFGISVSDMPRPSPLREALPDQGGLRRRRPDHPPGGGGEGGH